MSKGGRRYLRSHSIVSASRCSPKHIQLVILTKLRTKNTSLRCRLKNANTHRRARTLMALQDERVIPHVAKILQRTCALGRSRWWLTICGLYDFTVDGYAWCGSISEAVLKFPDVAASALRMSLPWGPAPFASFRFCAPCASPRFLAPSAAGRSRAFGLGPKACG